MSDPVEAHLIRQDDGGDCQNSGVPDDPDRTVGTIVCQRQDDGSTVVSVDCTLTANRTYNFFLKCVRLLGTITTGDEGIGFGKFVFSSSEVGDVYAFDCYSEQPVPGDIYQSCTVHMS
jgi:hypothetical protein